MTTATARLEPASAGASPAGTAESTAPEMSEVIRKAPSDGDMREKFIPVTRHALIERLTRPHVWAAGEAAHARRFLGHLSYWRGQSYNKVLLDLEQTYEPFSPDSDLLVTRKFTDAERLEMQHRVVDQMAKLLRKANFVQVDTTKIKEILTNETHYGLDLEIDLADFEELLVFYRGATSRKASKRTLRKLFIYKEEYDVPIFQRLFILFKLKSFDARVGEVMREANLERKDAEKRVKKARSSLPGEVKTDFVYMKLFKSLPQSDLEMVFPNGRVKFRMFDKLKLGVTAGGGLGMGVFGTAGKIAVATNPIALAGAVAGLGGIAARQVFAFLNQRTKYMVTLAQNLYFHSMADNRGVMTLLCDRASEEDVKEEAL
ncbi:MAG TPA: TMEM143 family protein, partial [Hyphomicrobiaceae bacterium]|nr:TMEM143 family protein [Hyphomicrobiaceae bacterium]